MISIVGLGNAASRIAEKFRQTKNYNVYVMNDGVQRNSKYKLRLKSYATAEEYEKNIPNAKRFFKEIDDHVQFFIVGSSFSSNYTLGILEQIKDKKIDVFYVRPDTELMTGVPKLLEDLAY